MIALLAVAAATLSPPAVAQPPLDPDPVQRVAALALSGRYGPLEPWQRVGYQKAIRNGSEARTFVLTGYGPWEGSPGSRKRRDGTIDRKGQPLHDGCLAANRLPYGSYVYLPAWGRLFVVRDCGGPNDQRREVTRHGGTWADVWLRRAREAKGRCDWSPTEGRVVR
jgi:hypothetical protein